LKLNEIRSSRIKRAKTSIQRRAEYIAGAEISP
jgi:hypothetical protein